MFKKILIPVDISHPELSNPAIQSASELATGGNSIRLMTVIPVMPSIITSQLPADYENKHHHLVIAELDKLAQKIKIADGHVSVAIRSGAIQNEILEEARSWGADLIVMGSSQPNLTTYILGTHAGDIVRHAHCSVLVIRT